MAATLVTRYAAQREPAVAPLLEPTHALMERGMLLGIKRRAERASRPRPLEGTHGVGQLSAGQGPREGTS